MYGTKYQSCSCKAHIYFLNLNGDPVWHRVSVVFLYGPRRTDMEDPPNNPRSCNDAESDGGNPDDSFNRMMRGIVPNNNGVDDHIGQVDDEIANALVDIEQPEDYGAPVRSRIAEAYVKTVTRPLSKETSDKLRKQVKIPENCKQFRVPKMNQELWQNIPVKARVADHEFQTIQATLVSALSSLASLSDQIAARANEMPKDMVPSLLKEALDTANLVGNQIQDLNNKRRLEVRSYLNPDCVGICTAKIAPSEYLFGSNLAETLKSTKATATVMKNTTFQTNRYQPYPQLPQQSWSDLNSFRQFQSPSARWNEQSQHGMINRPPMYNEENPAFQNPYQRNQN